MVLELIGGILICLSLYGIHKQRKIYFLKKYPPGSGEMMTIRSTENQFFGQTEKKALKRLKPKDVKYFRVISASKEITKGPRHTTSTIHTKTFEVWE